MKNNLLKTVIVFAFITILTTVIYAFNRHEATSESDVAYTIVFDECIGCGVCEELCPVKDEAAIVIIPRVKYEEIYS